MLLQQPMLGTPLDKSNPLNDGLVLHLAMNEGHGDKVYDLGGYRNHGTLNNFAYPPTVGSGWNPGQDGVALQFDGTNDYVDCGNNASLDITTAITIEAVMKPETVPFAGVVSRYHMWDTGWALEIEVADIGFVGYTVADGWFNHKVAISPNVWQRVIATFDGQNFALYKNGVLKTSGATSAITTLVAPVVNLEIGGELTEFYNGSIGFVRILNRAYTAKEALERHINPWGVYLQ